jgi:hypothetical protein
MTTFSIASACAAAMLSALTVTSAVAGSPKAADLPHTSIGDGLSYPQHHDLQGMMLRSRKDATPMGTSFRRLDETYRSLPRALPQRDDSQMEWSGNKNNG